RVRLYMGSWVISRPSRKMRPELGLVSPKIMLKMVVLPAPLGPSSPTISPRLAWKSTPWTTVRRPYTLTSRSASSCPIVSTSSHFYNYAYRPLHSTWLPQFFLQLRQGGEHFLAGLFIIQQLFNCLGNFLVIDMALDELGYYIPSQDLVGYGHIGFAVQYFLRKISSTGHPVNSQGRHTQEGGLQGSCADGGDGRIGSAEHPVSIAL